MCLQSSNDVVTFIFSSWRTAEILVKWFFLETFQTFWSNSFSLHKMHFVLSFLVTSFLKDVNGQCFFSSKLFLLAFLHRLISQKGSQRFYHVKIFLAWHFLNLPLSDVSSVSRHCRVTLTCGGLVVYVFSHSDSVGEYSTHRFSPIFYLSKYLFWRGKCCFCTTTNFLGAVPDHNVFGNF